MVKKITSCSYRKLHTVDLIESASGTIIVARRILKTNVGFP